MAWVPAAANAGVVESWREYCQVRRAGRRRGESTAEGEPQEATEILRKFSARYEEQRALLLVGTQPMALGA